MKPHPEVMSCDRDGMLIWSKAWFSSSLPPSVLQGNQQCIPLETGQTRSIKADGNSKFPVILSILNLWPQHRLLN